MADLNAGKRRKMSDIQLRSSWSNLPDDVICLILNRLHYVDQVRFRAVCKGWRETNIKGRVKSPDKLPWMIAIDSHSSYLSSPPRKRIHTTETQACYLFDPLHQRKHTIDTSITRSGLLLNSLVVASKHGWILFGQGTGVRVFHSFFFYSPFTDEIIQVPKFHRDCRNATFTTSPVSSDCQIFAVNNCDRKIYIGIYRFGGDGSWSEFSFDVGEEYSATSDIEYADGILYTTCFNKSVVGAFNVALKEWKVYPFPVGEDHFIYFGGRLIECNGDIFMAGNGENRYSYREWIVFKWDRLQMKWLETKCLDAALFIGDTSVFYPILKTEEELVISEFRNTIHSCDFNILEVEMTTRWPPNLLEKLLKIYRWDPAGLLIFWIQLPELK